MASSALSILPPARMLDFAASELHTTERCGLLPRHDTIAIDRGGSHAQTSPSGLHTVRTDGCGLQHPLLPGDRSGIGENFEDAQSGISVTLQSSEVKELSEGEFMATLALNQPSRPTVEANSTNVDPEMSHQPTPQK